MWLETFLLLSFLKMILKKCFRFTFYFLILNNVVFHFLPDINRAACFPILTDFFNEKQLIRLQEAIKKGLIAFKAGQTIMN